ncbi:MAG: hypothetical protein RL477_786, partial [Pseudomonadota bacterium]
MTAASRTKSGAKIARNKAQKALSAGQTSKSAGQKALSAGQKTKPAGRARARANDSLAVARRVFAIEAEGLAEAARRLDQRFDAAIDILHKIPGRVVVSGMGKSGHVAHKIAATLAST